MFSLQSSEEKRRQRGGKQPSREDPRTLEKDLKALTTFYVNRHMFIKVCICLYHIPCGERKRFRLIPCWLVTIQIHMIYMQFADEYPGAKFHQLALFYHVIATTPACIKILKYCEKVRKSLSLSLSFSLPLSLAYNTS